MYGPREQLRDPHYQVRGYARWVDQQGLGWMAFEGPAFRASGMKDVRITQAPLIGEHTREIARDQLGLDADEIDQKIAEGVLEVTE
jgi:crotonobetainyl-CoA:carnitine CoA-transferase CaiB-like acyl-CoA transferase